jgi:hypothetical protein
MWKSLRSIYFKKVEFIHSTFDVRRSLVSAPIKPAFVFGPAAWLISGSDPHHAGPSCSASVEISYLTAWICLMRSEYLPPNLARTGSVAWINGSLSRFPLTL